MRDDRALFDAGRDGVTLLLNATGTKSNGGPQARVLDLLAGAANPSDVDSHTQIVQDMMRILEAQHIVPLDDLFGMADHVDRLVRAARSWTLRWSTAWRGASARSSSHGASLSAIEKNALSFGYWTDKHVDGERKLNLRAAVDKMNGEKAKDTRGLLAPFLRDTLVAYNYAHYAPPGAQVLYTNPMFVRSHDFLGVQGSNHMWRTTEVFGSGWPSNGGGRLVGSLAGLPYALAEAEQNFLVPEQTQALIWGDLVPQMIASAVIPRWWNVTPSQLHWVALHMRYAEELLAAAALDQQLRQQVLGDLSAQAAAACVAPDWNPAREWRYTGRAAEGHAFRVVCPGIAHGGQFTA